MASESNERSKLGDIFDRTFRSLHGLPDVTSTKTSTVRSVHPVLEATQTFIVQTLRRRDENSTKDWAFIEYVGADGSVRIVLPPEVCDVIARQRDALGTKNRKIAAKREAQRRKAEGIQPAFLNAKKKPK